MTTIGEDTFWRCEALESVTFADGSKLTQIGKNAFSGSALKSIEIPAGTTVIGDYAFGWCSAMESVTIADGSMLETINEHAFYLDGALKSFAIPSSVKTIKQSAFEECTGLQTVTIEADSKLSVVEDRAFYNCGGTLVFKGTIEQWKALYKAGKIGGGIIGVECENGKWSISDK